MCQNNRHFVWAGRVACEHAVDESFQLLRIRAGKNDGRRNLWRDWRAIRGNDDQRRRVEKLIVITHSRTARQLQHVIARPLEILVADNRADDGCPRFADRTEILVADDWRENTLTAEIFLVLITHDWRHDVGDYVIRKHRQRLQKQGCNDSKLPQRPHAISSLRWRK